MKQKFTLIELLITISILAILAALLLPAFHSARSKGRSVFCMNNVKTMTVIALSYSLENDDYILQEYTAYQDHSSRFTQYAYCQYFGTGRPDLYDPKAAYNCPEESIESDWTIMGAVFEPSAARSSISWNRTMKLAKLGFFQQASKTGYTLENVNAHKNIYSSLQDNGKGTVHFRHGGNRAQSNVGFLDGHVAVRHKNINLPTHWNPRWSSYSSSINDSWIWSAYSGGWNTNSALRNLGI